MGQIFSSAQREAIVRIACEMISRTAARSGTAAPDHPYARPATTARRRSRMAAGAPHRRRAARGIGGEISTALAEWTGPLGEKVRARNSRNFFWGPR